MSLLRFVSVTSYPLIGLLSVCLGDSASLTVQSPSSSIAQISLIPNEANSIDISDNSFRSNNGDLSDTFTIKMDIFNTQCDGIETIKIDVFGGEVNGDVDAFALFSVKNSNDDIEFMSITNDWDGGMRVEENGDKGGVFIAPCGSKQLFKTNDENYVNNFLSGVTFDYWEEQRARLAGGDNNNWDLISTKGIGHVSPLSYKLINDPDSSKISLSFSAPGYNEVECTLDSDSFDTFSSGNDYIILFGADAGTVKYDKFDVSVECDGTNIYSETTQSPEWSPDYTRVCYTYGDPHFESWDGQSYHFQGEGYFDYVKSCEDPTSGLNYLPFKVSARHDYCGEPYTCVRQTVIILDDGKEILYPSFGDDITPRFGNDYSSAIGKHEFIDNNGNKVIYKVFETLFEISYIYNNEESFMKVFYEHDRLRFETTESMVASYGDKFLCGLCGTLDGNSTNELTKCDTFEEVSEKYADSLLESLTPIMNTTAYENVNEFGESCCNRELDFKYLEKSDCKEATPAPIEEETPKCWKKAQFICRLVYLKYFNECGKETAQSKVDSCAMDFCAIDECKVGILDDSINYGLIEAINDGCLDTTVPAAIVDKYSEFFPQVLNFCYD